jgi:hypothetical protein
MALLCVIRVVWPNAAAGIAALPSFIYIRLQIISVCVKNKIKYYFCQIEDLHKPMNKLTLTLTLTLVQIYLLVFVIFFHSTFFPSN